MAHKIKHSRLNSANRLGKDHLKNSDSLPEYTEVEEERFKLKRELFASILESISDEREALKNLLQKRYESLSEWNAHYDYNLWNMVEEHFNFLWLELEHEMYLGVEYGLYEEIKNLFLELRNFLQWTGRIKERIFFAAWLRREAESREDFGIICFAISSLVWSYTSSGCYQDLQKAYELWDQLVLYVQPTDSSVEFDGDGKNLKKSLKYLYSELLIEAQENGVRLAIRKREFDKAFIRIEKGKNTIEELFEQESIAPRLRKRFNLAFNYHKGIIFYLMQECTEAEKLFHNISRGAEAIGWNRAVKGAKSWLATLAMEKQDYNKCENILEDISSQETQGLPDKLDKRDGFCYLIKSENFNKAGQKKQAKESQEIAINIFKKCINSELESGLGSLVLLSYKK